MNITYETLGILTFLIPGFLSSIIYSRMVFRNELDNWNKFIEALIFSFIIYTIFSIWNGDFPVFLIKNTNGDVTEYLIRFTKKELIQIFGVSVFLAILVGSLNNRDLFMAMLRKVQLTKKTSRDSVWADVFVNKPKYVIVNFNDKRRLLGYPEYYSDDLNEGVLYIMRPKWIEEEENEYEGNSKLDGILVLKKDIEYIEFFN